MLKVRSLGLLIVFFVMSVIFFGCDTKKEAVDSEAVKTEAAQTETAQSQKTETEDDFCTRENLKNLANRYFEAIAAHDSSMMPIAENVKFTENGHEIAVGDGFWKSAGKVLLTRHLIDTFKCGTHTQAVVEENDAEGKPRPILFGLRLQYKDREITEIETIIAREKEFAFTPQGVLATKDEDWETVLPPEERSSRLAMVAAADDYFEMFSEEPHVSTPFAEICDRWENGAQTTVKNDQFPFPEGGREHNCSPKGLVIDHPPRRVPLVDVEAGIVVAYVHFAGLPDFHMFKMRNGKVDLIQAVIGPQSPSTGWPIEPLCLEK